MQSFTTEFGHVIPFVPGYFKRNSGYAHYTKGTQLHDGLAKVEGTTLGFPQPLKNWVGFSALVHFLSRYGLLQPRKAGVDLGGASGTCIRLFKAAGLLDYSVNVDIDDYQHLVSEKFFAGMLPMLRDIENQGPDFHKLVRRAKEVYDHCQNLGIGDGLVREFPREPTLDKNFHLDLMELPGTYDFATSLYCFDYFDLDRLLPKLRAILNPGGVFVGYVEYWWWPVNSTGIVGDFPYAGARLSLGDLTRYYTEHHPDLLPNLELKYNYFHQGKHHPTLTEWFALARKHGLRPLAVERVVPKTHHRLPDCPPRLFASPWFDEREVLRDIHYLKPDVTADDLFTSGLRIALTPA